MRDIEGRVFAAGMPVAALMEKVAGKISQRIQALYPLSKLQRVGILVGPGHNGGDALVVARELHFSGYQVLIYCPFSKLKDLTAQHAQYTKSLGIRFVERVDLLCDCQLLIDGLFGFGLERSLSEPITMAIEQLNCCSTPIISIDLPSGLHTDTGEVMGKAIRASRTLCLGLWKLAFLQDRALDYIGEAELIDFDLPLTDIEAVLGSLPDVTRFTTDLAHSSLPLHRPPVTHKYQQGHLLLICGSRQYAGGAILAGLGARGSGVGMLSIAVPTSLKPILTAKLPEALVIECPETETGAIAHLRDLDLAKYSAIACGCGITQDAITVVQSVLAAEKPLILDADALNILASLGEIPRRQSLTILTPHAGEFKRLFPQINLNNRINASCQAASESSAVVLLKGARTIIARPNGKVDIIVESTPALARGGSGDVLTGLMGGLIALANCAQKPLESMVATAAWWHAQAAILAARERTELGVDAHTLTEYLIRAILS
ncbi:bifunctional ADP-dependent NAD(P)H-hydrate dehydratase/NAD(P)H-hydrate epimerase [Merismopedia glauca CCAP 1448/3]|uniref:Bifunctional NAD(P)H-hydrate repair enzyme n=2 Tax=Merismopedia TaxID=53402 RepID=A0A2T1C731_9CYAN|nr:bifunctional ADP-dependent NAD(P)H-hydrate dehydratase/NAD(P)H-hydrate epimerase [Merismopedia glauca CCAP 1448/3]